MLKLLATWGILAGILVMAESKKDARPATSETKRPAEFYDDYYYYDEEPPAPQKSEDYNLSDLVSAWKAYVKEKKNGDSDEEYDDEGGRRNRPPPRPQQPEYECPPRTDSYRNPDPMQCDRYFECNIKGEEKAELCPDGFAFDIKSENCDYPTKVNCSGRPLLQEPQPTENCPRANGFFAFPANISCQKFWDCRQGKSYLQVCPAGVIFDPLIDACSTPDQSNRLECAAGKFLGFECPQYSAEEPLRFGNHDRLPHPLDCQKFFSCLRTGQPRAGGCPRKKVFSKKSGQCSDPKDVEGCETYWEEKLAETDSEYPDYY